MNRPQTSLRGLKRLQGNVKSNFLTLNMYQYHQWHAHTTNREVGWASLSWPERFGFPRNTHRTIHSKKRKKVC